MLVKLAVLVTYFGIVLALGLAARGRRGENASQFFLAGRGLSPLVLLGTMAATNFSAFTIFGASGAGYRDGLAFYPIMAFGTGFMALTFILLGLRIWRLGRQHDLVTPAELIGKVYGNRRLSALFALAMVVFTVPYLALQPLAAGKVIGQLFDVPSWVGAVLVTGIILLYTVRGGLRAVARNDVFQGLTMLVLMVVALALVVAHNGGWTVAFGRVLESSPALLSRPGERGVYTPAIWFSYLLLWFFCDPMFPQLFQRFYVARSARALAQTALLYPLICTVFFALPIAMGVLGRLNFPGLRGAEADNIVPLLATQLGGDLLGTLVLTAGLAALMSTMDSQLLTVGSIFTRDLYPFVSGRQAQSGRVGRLFVVALALVGLAVALGTDATILDLGVTAFTGLAVLFPTVFFGLYLDKPRPAAGAASIVVGEALALAYHLGLLPAFGFLAVVPVVAASLAAYLAVQGLAGGRVALPRPRGADAVAVALLAGVFLAALDFWRWGEVGAIVLGWPLWAWHFVALSLVQCAVTWWWLRRATS
ncbi:MAG: sodium:solute symporter family protein [Chloroflexota bacterium]